MPSVLITQRWLENPESYEHGQWEVLVQPNMDGTVAGVWYGKTSYSCGEAYGKGLRLASFNCTDYAGPAALFAHTSEFIVDVNCLFIPVPGEAQIVQHERSDKLYAIEILIPGG